MQLKLALGCVTWLIVWTLSGLALAGDSNKDLSLLSDEEIDERLRFIEQRLEGVQQHARYWQNGWATFYTVTTVGNAAGIALTNDHDNRVNYSVNTVKSAMGMADRFLKPLEARLGADEIRAMPSETRADKLAQLTRAEEQLRRNAKRADTRTSWKRHFWTTAVNLVGGGITLAFGEKGHAAQSTFGGIAMGQIVIWTEPGQPVQDLQDYERRFVDKLGRKKIDWDVRPMAGALNGAQFVINF